MNSATTSEICVIYFAMSMTYKIERDLKWEIVRDDPAPKLRTNACCLLALHPR